LTFIKSHAPRPYRRPAAPRDRRAGAADRADRRRFGRRPAPHPGL